MAAVPFTEFTGSRLRFQRLSDQQIFAGWLTSLKDRRLLVAAEDRPNLNPSDRFLFQVQGPISDAYFIAASKCTAVTERPIVDGATAMQVVQLQALDHEFELLTPIQIRESQQQARKAIGTMVATLHTVEKYSEVLIADASSGGMGVISWQELEKADEVRVDIQSEALEASFDCFVRHCRPETRLIGAYRVGLQFVNPDRISLALWRRLIR